MDQIHLESAELSAPASLAPFGVPVAPRPVLVIDPDQESLAEPEVVEVAALLQVQNLWPVKRPVHPRSRP